MADQSKEARNKADAKLRLATERKIDGERAWAEHLAQDKSVADRTSRLRSERLAREAQAPKEAEVPVSAVKKRARAAPAKKPARAKRGT